MKFFIFIIIIFFACPVLASDEIDEQTFCRLLPAYRPAQGVEYQAGVDVQGRPVVSADINDGSAFRNFESIEIPVEIDLVKKFGLTVPAAVELRPTAALISIHNDGKVDYNGQDVSQQAYQLCDGQKDE